MVVNRWVKWEYTSVVYKNEVIKTILSLFFFYKKNLHAQKAQNGYMRTKNKRAAFLCAKKHLRRRKSLIRLFAFCAFYAFYAICVFCAFSAFAWLLFCAFYVFCTFCAFCACKIFS